MHPKCFWMAALWMAIAVPTAVANGSADANHGKDGCDSVAATAGNDMQSHWTRLRSLAPTWENLSSDGLASGNPI